MSDLSFQMKIDLVDTLIFNGIICSIANNYGIALNKPTKNTTFFAKYLVPYKTILYNLFDYTLK